MRIAALFIYQVVTLSRGNISCADGPGLCSNVLGFLQQPVSLTSSPIIAETHVAGCSDTAVVTTTEEICPWGHCQSSVCPTDSLVLAGDCSVFRRPNTTIRQQFIFALLEDCSFFAHLVLRCVRGGDGSPHGVTAPRGVKPRPVSGIQRRAQPVTRPYAQPELQNPRDTSFPELETLWAEVASRHVRTSVSEGGRP